MEGGELNCLFEILESSSPFWAPLNFDDTNYFLSPQNCNIINTSSSPHQNADCNITNPPPQHQTTEFIQQLNENPNFNSSSSVVVHEQADSDKRGERKKKQNEREKRNENLQTWYKGPWTKTEDRKLKRLVSHYGRGNWSKVASKMPGRIGKQCRERWHNNLGFFYKNGISR